MQAPKVLLFFLFLISIPDLRAQTNFLKGYYITPLKDTVTGYIDYRSEQSNYKVCIFKFNLDSKPIKLYPNDIVGFTVQKMDIYEKRSFKAKKGEVLLGFFKLIVKGKLSLLRYQSRYFVKTAANQVFEITKRLELFENSKNLQDEDKLKVDYSGLGMLIVLMNDCDEVTRAFLENEYKRNPDFHHIFVTYNKCVGEVSEPDAIRIKPHFDLGVLAAPALTKLNLSFPFQNANFSSDFNFSAGAYTSIFIPKVTENLRSVLEARYGKYKHYAYFTDILANNDLFIDYSFLKVPLLIRYTHRAFFLDVGIQNVCVLDQNIRWRVESRQSNNIFTSDAQLTPLSKQTGFLVGIGMNYKLAQHLLLLSLRLSQSQASNHPNKPVFQSLEVILAFQLTK